MPARAREDAEKSRFGIDRVQAAVVAGANPGNVVANRPRLPTGHGPRRDEHRHVGLAARRWKCPGDITDRTVLVSAAGDQHVLREPAFVARPIARQAERQALFPQQRVASVSGAD